MTLDEARTLLVVMRAGLSPELSRKLTDEALTVTGDMPTLTRRERFKRDLYDDGHAFADDHSCRVRPAKLPPYTITALQLEAVDDTAGIDP